jgi:hypothetical protein
MSIASPIIGASNLQVWKPTTTVGTASDATAPFALGTTLTCVAVAGRDLAKFARISSAGVTSAGSVAIGTDGVTVASSSGNSWKNETGQALVEGDYAFLTTTSVTTP